MADKPDDLPTGSDSSTRSTADSTQDSATEKLLNDVLDSLARLGIGPSAALELANTMSSQDSKPVQSLDVPPLEVVDQTPDPQQAANSQLESVIDLPPPPTRIETEDVTMDIYPSVDPGNKEVTVNVKGKF